MPQKVMTSEIAGTWYTDDAENLAHEVDLYLGAVEQQVTDPVIALLLPHAGYRYSGMVAAQAVKQVTGRSYSRVVVIGPSHRVPMEHQVSLPDADAVRTPLGTIEIDRELADRLLQDPHFRSHATAHRHEHSVQIEFPFLQRALGNFRLLPIVCGQLDKTSARAIGKHLLECIDPDTLVVISSDFIHYGHSFGYVPFRDDVEQGLRNLDLGAFERIREHDLSGFLDYVDETGATICGRSAIAVLLAMLPGEADIRMMKYDTSGNLTGDWSHCVSYLSAAITGSWKLDGEETMPAGLPEADQNRLLRLARNRIERMLIKHTPELDLEITPAMQQVMGAFVTLHRQGQLRGCIGEIFPRRPLVEAVAEQAVNAAFHDPRFPALQAGELPDVEVEISALTAPHRVDGPNDIEIGRHGIVLYKGMHSAVFLPQVAVEQGWGLEQTLSHLCMKAGLSSHAWQSGCEFHVFEAIVFGEGSAASQ